MLIASISYNILHFNSLIKDTWVDSPIIFTIILAISLILLTTSVFIDYQNNIPLIPLYFLILFFEIIVFVCASSRMYSTSVIFSTIVFVLTGFEMLYMTKTKNKELSWLMSPFLFFSLFQISICDNIYKNNIDYNDLLEYQT